MKRAHVWISGRVQGVFFRQSAQREARRLDLRGWVRNLGDGSVEAVAEGGDVDVDAWVEWCRKGPSDARVDQIRVEAEAPQGENGFRVIP